MALTELLKGAEGGGLAVQAAAGLATPPRTPIFVMGRVVSPVPLGSSLARPGGMWMVANLLGKPVLGLQGGFCQQKHHHRNTDSKIGPGG